MESYQAVTVLWEVGDPGTGHRGKQSLLSIKELHISDECPHPLCFSIAGLEKDYLLCNVWVSLVYSTTTVMETLKNKSKLYVSSQWIGFAHLLS